MKNNIHALVYLCAICFVMLYSAHCVINSARQRPIEYVSIMHQTTTSAFGLEKHYTLIQAADGSVKRIDGILPIGDTIIIK